jgi:hypothetical protein
LSPGSGRGYSVGQGDHATDVEAYGHQFPAYRENPVAETLWAVGGLATDYRFASYYAAFPAGHGVDEAPDFQTTLAAVSALADGLRE